MRAELLDLCLVLRCVWFGVLGVVCGCCLVVWAWDFWWVFVLVAVGDTVWLVGALVFVICGWVLMGLFVCCVRLLLL